MEASFWGLWSRNPSSPSSPTSQDADGGTSIPSPTTPTATSLKSTSQLPLVSPDRTGGRERAGGGARSGSPVLTPAGPTPPISPATSEGSNPDSLSHSQASISRVEAEPLFRTCTHRTRSVFVPIHGRSWPRQAWELGPSGQAGLGEGPATLSSTKAVGRPKKRGRGHPNLVPSSIREPSDWAQAKPQASSLLRDLNADPRPRRSSKVGEKAASAPPLPVPAQDLLASDAEWRREPHRGSASATSVDLRLTGIREETPSPRRPLVLRFPMSVCCGAGAGGSPGRSI